ncbi:hypothetical protein RDI58_022946 [Solanum bulbocastanum]|uniref:Uncharacterized protein n=1 Tax=Solanum bulbocastanum TaxID=147425 RepID=A0AAN8Y6A1_SOLBU
MNKILGLTPCFRESYGHHYYNSFSLWWTKMELFIKGKTRWNTLISIRTTSQ